MQMFRLPFYRDQNLEHCFGKAATSNENGVHESTASDPHLNVNTQRMVSTFDMALYQATVANFEIVSG